MMTIVQSKRRKQITVTYHTATGARKMHTLFTPSTEAHTVSNMKSASFADLSRGRSLQNSPRQH